MGNAEEFSGQRSGLWWLRSAYRGPRPGAVGPPGTGRIRYAHGGAFPPGDQGGEAWLTGQAPGSGRTDLWVLVCGGIAAAAAFAAAFVASGGVAAHPAVPGSTVPAVVSQACPSPAAGPTP
jgi:hypothetical protein